MPISIANFETPAAYQTRCEQFASRIEVLLRRGDFARAQRVIEQAEKTLHEIRERGDELPLDEPIASLGLATREINSMEDAGIETIEDVLQWTPDELMGLRNFGPNTFASLMAALEKAGYRRQVLQRQNERIAKEVSR
jgi:DNA-directed RNA polymerase alpha subunit